jgi:hypothetical protein
MAQEARDFRDDLFLEDLEPLDKDMLDDAVKKTKSYNYRGLNKEAVFSEATKCFLEAVVLGLRHAGVDLDPLTFQAVMQNYQSKAPGDVEVENRVKYRGKEGWRNGTYIFKKGELVHFVGAPVEEKLSSLVIDARPHFIVRHNVRTS